MCFLASTCCFSLLLLLIDLNKNSPIAADKNGFNMKNRRNLYSHYHHFMRQNVKKSFNGCCLSSSEFVTNGTNNNKMMPFPFILKCPQTNKNVSAILWSLNGTALFSVFLASSSDDGSILMDIVNESPDDLLEGRQQWQTKDGANALIFRAKRGRYKFEVETGGKMRKEWFVLRINEVNVKQDRGEWRCQLMVKDRHGTVKVEAESRKSIEDRWDVDEEEANNGRQMSKKEQQQERHWRSGGNESPAFSFSFSKTDTDFVVFERTATDSAADLGTRLSQSRGMGEGIAYSRVDYVNPSVEAAGNLDDDIWLKRWKSMLGRRENPSKGQNCQIGLTFFLQIIIIMSIIFICN